MQPRVVCDLLGVTTLIYCDAWVRVSVRQNAYLRTRQSFFTGLHDMMLAPGIPIVAH